MIELLPIRTEACARPFYGHRVWIVLDGERLRRTIEPDTHPAGDGRTMGEFWDRVIVRTVTACALVGLGNHELSVEVEA